MAQAVFLARGALGYCYLLDSPTHTCLCLGSPTAAERRSPPLAPG